jgi:amino acid transporter
MGQRTPQQWRVVSAVVTALGVVITAATFLPWFAIEVEFTNPPQTVTRTESGFFDTDFGYVATAMGVCAVMLGLFCLVKPSTDPRLGRVLPLHLTLPIVGLAVVGISWVQAAGDTSNLLAPAYGLILVLVALVGWLVCGVLLRRMATAARAVPGSGRSSVLP